MRFSFLITAGFLALCLGTLGGNWLISIGHILLILGIISLLVLNFRESVAGIGKLKMSGWFLMGFLVMAALSIGIHWDHYENGWKDLKKLRYLPIILLVTLIPGAIACLRKEWVPRAALIAVGLAACVVCLEAIAANFCGSHLLTGKPVEDGRLGGVSGTVMTFAYSLQFFVILLGTVFIDPDRILSSLSVRGNQEKIRRWLWVTASTLFIVVLIAFFLSGSRGALAGVVAGGFVILLVSRKIWLWGLVVVATAIVGVWAVKSDSRYMEGADRARKLIWSNAALVALDHPSVGIGYRQLERRSHEFAKQYRLPKTEGLESGYYKAHAHNNFLEMFAGTGVIGGLMFFGFCFAWVRESWRNEAQRIWILPCVVAFIVSGMFESTFIDSEVLNVVLLLYLASQVWGGGQDQSSEEMRFPSETG